MLNSRQTKRKTEGLFALPKSGTKAPYLADEEKQVFPEGSATHLRQKLTGDQTAAFSRSQETQN